MSDPPNLEGKTATIDGTDYKIKVIGIQHGWICRNCGGDHGGPGCDNPDIPVIYYSYGFEPLGGVDE